MLRSALVGIFAAAFCLDLAGRLAHCKYQLNDLVQTATERALGVACTQERHIYANVMQPSCADYEAQLEVLWQFSYFVRCVLNSYDIFKTWWFFVTIVALSAYAVRAYFAKPPDAFTVYQLPHHRGFSLLPQIKK
jgi:hypothetical protein